MENVFFSSFFLVNPKKGVTFAIGYLKWQQSYGKKQLCHEADANEDFQLL